MTHLAERSVISSGLLPKNSAVLDTPQRPAGHPLPPVRREVVRRPSSEGRITGLGVTVKAHYPNGTITGVTVERGGQEGKRYDILIELAADLISDSKVTLMKQNVALSQEDVQLGINYERDRPASALGVVNVYVVPVDLLLPTNITFSKLPDRVGFFKNNGMEFESFKVTLSAFGAAERK